MSDRLYSPARERLILPGHALVERLASPGHALAEPIASPGHALAERIALPGHSRPGLLSSGVKVSLARPIKRP